jgi:hypothetical protein
MRELLAGTDISNKSVRLRNSLKGFAQFSSEEQDVKNCLRDIATVLEDSQKVTTKEESEVFTTNLFSKIAQHENVIKRESSKLLEFLYKGEKLPGIKICQQVMKAYPVETQQVTMLLTLSALNEPVEEKKEILESFIKTVEAIPTITTEEEAQDLSYKLLHKYISTIVFINAELKAQK